MAGTLKTSIFLNFQNKFKERCTTLFVEAYSTSISNKSILLEVDKSFKKAKDMLSGRTSKILNIFLFIFVC